MKSLLRSYYVLVKPGIVYGNAFTVIAGSFLAVSLFHHFQLSTFLGVLVGTSLVIASACVINNIIDRKIDLSMERTKKRPLVTGKISVSVACWYGILLGVIGMGLLFITTNLLTVIIGLIAYVFYVVIYGYFKRTSEYGTLVGAIPGALPPVAGYTAFTNHLDSVTVLVFLLLVAWQMVHFYAIGIYRRDEYQAAHLPILPVKRGKHVTALHMVGYAILFLLVSITMSALGFEHLVFCIVVAGLGVWWLYQCFRLLSASDGTINRQARSVFMWSLIINLVFCLMLSIGAYLP